jgi:chromosome partitioning protein
MRTIAFLNQKGGVGKTTSTVNIGAGLVQLKKKVLLIDLDPQASLTHSLGIEPLELTCTIYELLKKECLFEEAALKKNNVTILPASIALSGFEKECTQIDDKEYILKKTIKTLPKFDYILIDCPPSLGFLTINALAAAQEIIIPVQTEFLALQGLSQLLDTITVIQQNINPKLHVSGIIGTRFNRRKMHNDVIEFLQIHFRDKIFNTVIRENIALAEAPSFGKTIYDHNPSSNGAKDYKMLCKEIIKQEASR